MIKLLPPTGFMLLRSPKQVSDIVRRRIEDDCDVSVTKEGDMYRVSFTPTDKDQGK